MDHLHIDCLCDRAHIDPALVGEALTWILILALYAAIPVLGVRITGRQLAWQGWLLVILLWPVLWLIMGPEELP